MSWYLAGYASPQSRTTYVGARTFEVEDASSSSVTAIISVRHTTTGTAAAGIGARINLQAENGSGTTVTAASIDGVLSTVTNGSESGRLILNTISAGSAVERARFSAADIVFNENANDVDFRIEGTTATNLFITDAGADAVYIGTTSIGQLATFQSTGIVFNENAGDQDVRMESQNITSMFHLDASTDTLGIGGGAGSSSRLAVQGNFSASAARQLFYVAQNTLTATGNITTQGWSLFEQPLLAGDAAGRVVTTGDTVNIQHPSLSGANARITTSSGLRVSANYTMASNASMQGNSISIAAHTVTVTGTTQVTGSPGVAGINIGAISINDSTDNVVTVDSAAAVYIAAAPAITGGSTITLTAAWAMWIDSGNTRTDGVIFAELGAVGAPAYSFISSGTTDPNTGMWSPAADTVSIAAGGVENVRWGTAESVYNEGAANIDFRAESQNLPNMFMLDASADTIGVGAAASATARFSVSGNISTGAEFNNISSAAVTYTATGNVATQRFVNIAQNTVAGNSGTRVITTCAALEAAMPTTGANARITAANGVRVTMDSTQVSNASLQVNGVTVASATVSISGTTQVTSSPGVAGIRVAAISIDDVADASLTIDSAAAIYVAAAPAITGGSTITLTASWALWIDAGNTRNDGIFFTELGSVGAPAYSFISSGTTDPDTGMWSPSANIVAIAAGGAENVRWGTTESVYNENAGNIDFRIESQNIANFFVLDASADTCAFGATPSASAFIYINRPNVSSNNLTILQLDATTQTITANPTSPRTVYFEGITYTASSAQTITSTNLATLRIAAAPNATSTNITMTEIHGIQVGANGTAGITSASWQYDALNVDTHTITIAGTGTTGITSTPGFSGIRIDALTLTKASGAVTVDSASALYIAAAPVAAGAITLTASWALWIDAGNMRTDGIIFAELGSASAPAYSFISSGTTDPNTGIFSPAADAVAVSAGGAEIVRWTLASSGGGWMIMPEADSDPAVANLASMDAVAIYMKNNKIVFAYNYSGTIGFLNIPLDTATTTWTNSTTAP